VLSVHDVNNVYHVPGLLQSQNLHEILRRRLGLSVAGKEMLTPDLDTWNAMAHSIDSSSQSVTIALIGKYTGLQDSYLSVIKALKHASIACNVKLELEWIEASCLIASDDENSSEQISSDMTKEEAWELLKAADGVIIPGGFGQRGWEGKIAAAGWCRQNDKPCLGVCLGFQAMVVEYARSVLGWEAADSTEFNEDSPHPVVIFMPEIDKETMGGTMRLGARKTAFTHQRPDGSMSLTQTMYDGKHCVMERHRHRYEVNPETVDAIHGAGLLFVGRDESGTRMEVAELMGHKYYVGCQFHPEFLSRPLKPSPPFHGLILAATGQLEDFLKAQKAKIDG
jgi:CTP synthase